MDGKSVVEEIFMAIGEEKLNQRIATMRPIIKEKLRKIIKKTF